MKENIENFYCKMLDFFPNKLNEYNEMCCEMQQDYSERLDTIIVEDLFMPEVVELLRKNTDTKLLKKIFDYFEIVSNNADKELENIFSVTTLEILGNEKNILENARTYMGPKTASLQYEADRALGRIVRPPSVECLGIRNCDVE